MRHDAPDSEDNAMSVKRERCCKINGIAALCTITPWRTLAQCAICARARRQAAHELKATFALPPQDAHLMPKGDELKFQGGTTSNTEGEQGNEGGENRDHALVWRRRKNLYSFSGIWNFEQAHRPSAGGKLLVRLPMALARSPCRSGDNLTRSTHKGGVEI